MSQGDGLVLERHFGDVVVPKLVALAGLPASGKSTLADVLAGRVRGTVISVDPIEEAILSAGIASDQPTGLAAYLVAAKLAEQVLSAGHTVVVDAVNAVEPARMQWRELAARAGVDLKVIEVVCSDEQIHRERLQKRRLTLTGEASRAVEQSLEGYEEWAGESAMIPRMTLDSTRPLGENVEAALAFVQS